MFPAALALPLLLAPAVQDAAEAPAPPDDARVREAWSYLLPGEQEEAIEWFLLEVSLLDTFQSRCRDWILGSLEEDPGFWPTVGPERWFDPTVHAPRQPIPRRLLDPDDRRAEKMAEAVRRGRPPRRLQSAWVYDWARRLVLRVPAPTPEAERERVFANALAGFAPDTDLAEAIVLSRLDGGHVTSELAAFAHLYTDRDGRAYPGVSLYDAWASGAEIEMPDVDVLGIVHTVLDEWDRYVAPVPGSKHQRLYSEVGELFTAARRYRGLREAIASTYLIGTPLSPDGYNSALVRFHAMWETHRSDPAALAKELPAESEAWTGFLEGWAERCREDPELYRAAVRRQEALTADSARVRATLVWVLEQLGAFERTERPPLPKPKAAEPKPAGSGTEGGGDGGGGPAVHGAGDEVDGQALEKALKELRRLRPGARAALEDELRAALSQSSAKQVELVTGVVGDGGTSAARAKLDELEPPGPHGRGRGRIRPTAKAWQELAATVAPAHPPRELVAGVVYDFASGEVLRLPAEKGAEARAFENALAGFHPDQDLAEARVLQRLDRPGRHREEARFFAHDYASLAGKFYEGISLFEVWSHEIPVDVPDVDAKAYAEIVHGETGLPPVLGVHDRELWYPRMADSLFALRRHVRIARAIAACWFDGRPSLPDGYAQSVDTLHATICLEARSLDRVAERFERLGPAFLERSLADVGQAGDSAWNAGNARRDALERGREAIRSATLDLLRAKGFLD